MHWILYLGLERSTDAEDLLLETVQDLGLPHTLCKVVPFSHELVPEPEIAPGDKVVVYGGTVMRKIAEEQGWDPGYYWDEGAFQYEAWYKHWGNHLLNADSVVCRFEDVPLQTDRFFIRPCSSDKTFTAQHLEWCDYLEWVKDVRNGDVSQHYQDLTLNTLVAVAQYKDIQNECRFFVAGGKIVTGSFYKAVTWSKRLAFYGTPWYDEDMERFVQDRIAEWQPHRAFVLDIASVSEGYKIIEINAYNSSGLYACDARRIVLALEEMEANA